MASLSTNSESSPFFSLKFPWNSLSENSKPCCNIELPFLFKSIQTLASIATHTLTSIQNQNKTAEKTFPSKEEQGEAEQRALACALKSGKDATLIEFYSPKCRLCNSIMGLVLDMEKKNEEWVSLVLADAENEKWLPELVHYDISYVPCFLLLDKHGRAIAKTGVPVSRMHVIAGLSHLLQLKRPKTSSKARSL